jgi:hypothetical protein
MAVKLETQRCINSGVKLLVYGARARVNILIKTLLINYLSAEAGCCRSEG